MDSLQASAETLCVALAFLVTLLAPSSPLLYPVSPEYALTHLLLLPHSVCSLAAVVTLYSLIRSKTPQRFSITTMLLL